MVESKDTLKSFIPENEPNFVIMGTMVAVNARTLNKTPPAQPFFYYNNNRNHFWRVLQHLFEPKKEIKRLTIPEKKDFLNLHGIAIQNLVNEIRIPNINALDPSDTVLFQAFKKNRLSFKKLSPRMKKLIATKPLFFTCRSKPGIDKLVQGFFHYNKTDLKYLENIWYLPTPTRCNPKKRSELWKKEMQTFLEQKNFKNFLK